MQWASTIKEVELSHFFKEWPAMWKRFWDIWVVSWIIILGVIMMATPIVPEGYRISNFTCILPIMTQACCHFLYPIVLNPWREYSLWRKKFKLTVSAPFPVLEVVASIFLRLAPTKRAYTKGPSYILMTFGISCMTIILVCQ